MTTLNQARSAIYSAFIEAWEATGQPLCDYTFENEQFDPEAREDGTRKPWVRVAVHHRTNSAETLGRPGNRKFQRNGSVFVQLFVPIDTGLNQMDALATAAENIFVGRRLNGVGVSFNDVDTRENPPEGSWFGMTVEAQFIYFEIK